MGAVALAGPGYGRVDALVGVVGGCAVWWGVGSGGGGAGVGSRAVDVGSWR